MPDSSFSILTLLVVTLGTSTPLLLAALGGLFSERSGIVNIGLEGMMLTGAFFAALTVFLLPPTASWGPWLGFVVAGVAGGGLALLHAAISIDLRADQIISGVALNILAAQGTIFLSVFAFGGKGGSGLLPKTISTLSIGAFSLSPFVPLSWLMLALAAWVLFRTPFGLRLRACGEHPAAARAAGIPVRRIRYICVVLSGVLSGFAGAVLVNGAGNFSKNMTAGRGYIALAALIFGAWKPLPTLFACLLFGVACALGFQFQGIPILNLIPPEFLTMLPYILTILALMGLVGRAKAPAALGLPDESH